MGPGFLTYTVCIISELSRKHQGLILAYFQESNQGKQGLTVIYGTFRNNSKTNSG